MKSNLKIILSVAVASFFGSAVAKAQDLSIIPHVGLDVKWRHVSFKKDFGKNETAHSYIQPEPYVGIQLNDYFGIQAGYAVGLKRERTRETQFGDMVFNDPANFPFKARTRTSFRGFNGNLVGVFPMSNQLPLSLVGILGVSNLQVRVKYQEVNVNSGQVQFDRTFKSTKWIPKVQVGVQYMITDEAGLRALVGWEKTSAFKGLKTKELPSSVLRASIQDSITAGLGVFYRFK